MIYEEAGGYYLSNLQGGSGNATEIYITFDYDSITANQTVVAKIHSHYCHNENILYQESEWENTKQQGFPSYVIDKCGCVYVLHPTAKNYMDYEIIRLYK